ncbi:MAG TPA: archease [Thermoanaerobaculia bacterium]|nr:archease [Thermoanaerobaculia bacterium]
MYQIENHVADVRLRVRAPSLEELFRDAMRGMYALMRPELEQVASLTRTIAVEESADLTSLLVDFLNEVLHRAHVGREVFHDAAFSLLDDTNVTAILTGIAPASFEEDVKAVTYHEAEVRQEGGEWTTMLVFDI